MDTLRPDERAAVVLHYRHELTHPEIADTLGVPLGTVKSLIRRARLRLQEGLHTHGQGQRMTSDDELDAFLISALQEPALEDRGFSRAVSERLIRHRRRRRSDPGVRRRDRHSRRGCGDGVVAYAGLRVSAHDAGNRRRDADSRRGLQPRVDRDGTGWVDDWS